MKRSVVFEPQAFPFILATAIIYTNYYLLKPYILYLTDVEALFEHAAANHVFKCGAHDGVALARLHVQEVDAEIQFAVHADASTFLDVL